MLSWLACILTGRHDYSPWCEDGAMFLRCPNCGRRSQGWRVTARDDEPVRNDRLERAAAARVSVMPVVAGE